MESQLVYTTRTWASGLIYLLTRMARFILCGLSFLKGSSIW